MTLDGYEAPIELKAALTVSDGAIHVDYAGTTLLIFLGAAMALMAYVLVAGSSKE